MGSDHGELTTNNQKSERELANNWHLLGLGRDALYDEKKHRLSERSACGELSLLLKFDFLMFQSLLNCSGKVIFVSNSFLPRSCQRGQKELSLGQECLPSCYMRL